MEPTEAAELASEYAENLYDKLAGDKGRLASFLNSSSATDDTAIRGIVEIFRAELFQGLRDNIGVSGLTPGVDAIADAFESKMYKTLKTVAKDYFGVDDYDHLLTKTLSRRN